MGNHSNIGDCMSFKAHGHQGNHGNVILRAHKGAYMEAQGFLILIGYGLDLMKHGSHGKANTKKDPHGLIH